MATKKVLLTKSASNSKTLQQVADDVLAKVSGSSLSKILTSQDCIIFDADNTKNQQELYVAINELEHGSVVKDHTNFHFDAVRSTYEPGSTTDRYWHLDAITRLDYNHNAGSGLGTYSSTNDGEDVDIYIVDSGVRGASRPTGVGANLHPEFFSPDNKANLNGTSEQGDYRVYELPSALYTSPATGGSNEPSTTGNTGTDGHGTFAALVAAGINCGVANKAKIYSLRVSNDSGDIALSALKEACDAIYRHNDPSDSEYKGKTLDTNTRARPSIVNVSIGQDVPNPESPWMDRNERHVGQNYTFSVTASGSSDYTITGADANGAVSGSDPTITCKKGDTLTFQMNASGHPFHIQTDYDGTTSYNNLKGADGVSGAGTQTGGNVVFDTGLGLVGYNNGEFRYICQYHSGMTGKIDVEDANAYGYLGVAGDNTMEEAEYKLATLNGVTVCRSAGNGMTFFHTDSNANVDYGPLNTKVSYGARSAGQASKLDAEITYTDGYSRRGDETGYGSADNADILAVGALKVGANNKMTFANFTNYGDGVTIYAPGQGLNVPMFNWNTNTVTAADYSNGPHTTVSGTSFSSPIVAGMAAIWRQIHDKATGIGNPHNLSKYIEQKVIFQDEDDYTSISELPIGGWINSTNVSEGAAITRFMSGHTQEDEQGVVVNDNYRLKTAQNQNNVTLQLTTAEYSALAPAIGDVYEFEFPRVEDSPNAPDATTLLRNQRKEYTFNLGERRDYKVAVAGGKFTFERIQNGAPTGSVATAPALELDNGVVYRFDQTDVTNLSHPINISNTADGTHAGGDRFENYVDATLTQGAFGYKKNLRYFTNQGNGIQEVSPTTYESIAGNGQPCWIEWINPMGDTHPDVDSSVYPNQYHYYCKNHAGMGGTINQASTNNGFGNTTEAMIGGLDIEVFASKWRKITALDATAKTITFQADSNATSTEEGGGGLFNNGIKTVNYPNGDVGRWPMRFTKITGTFYENDAFWNWTENYSTVVSGTTKPGGGVYEAGEFFSQLEAEEGGTVPPQALGKPVRYFPIPKSRFTRESLHETWQTTHAYPNDPIYSNGPRWGRGMYDNVQHKFQAFPPALGTTSTYDCTQAIQPFIDLVASWTTASGSLGSYTDTQNINVDLSISAITTFANETLDSTQFTPVYELVSGGGRSPFTISGGNYIIDNSGLTLNGSTGLITGTVTADTSDTTFTIRVRDRVSDQYNDYTFVSVGTGSSSSVITITGQPSAATGDGSYPVDSGTASYTVAASDSLGTALSYQWQYATDSVQANLGNWTNVPSTGSFAGTTGTTASTLNVSDNLALNGYIFSCNVNSATAASSVRSNSVSLTITVTVSCTTWWSGQTTLFSANECAGTSGTCTQAEVEVQAVSSDGATLNLTPAYDTTLTGNETDIVSKVVDGNNFCLEAIGGNGSNGHPLYRVKLGQGAFGDGTTAVEKTDDTQTIKIIATHPTLGTTATAAGVGGPFTIESNYNESTPLSATGSVQSGTNHTLAVTYGHSGASNGVAASTIVWSYQLGGSSTWTIVDGTESWFSSRDDSTSNSSTLVITGSTALDQSKWQAKAYTDTASSGVTDTKDIAKYSAVNSTVQVLTVTAAPTITIERPSGVTPDNSVSIAKGTLSGSNFLLTLESDGLPDPATHGADFNPAIAVTNRTHKIIYRGGTNTPSLTPWTSGALGLFANGIAVSYPSRGTASLPNANQSVPAGFEFNNVHFADLLNIDSAGGMTTDAGEYRYLTSSFASTSNADRAWTGLERANAYYANSNHGGNDNFRHTDGHSKILGIAFDGHPIYGPWGYTTYNDNTSAPKRLTSSFTIAANDNHRPTGFKFTDQITFTDSTPSVTLTNGSFIQDYSYTPGSGDLDQSNGRYCVTPDFPNGTYAYFMPQDASLNPVYPYIVGTALRQAYYLPGTDATDPGGTNPQGPNNGGFDITSIFVKGITMIAETGGTNTREVTGDSASMAFGTAPYTYQWQKLPIGTAGTWTDIASNEIGFGNETTPTLSIFDSAINVDDFLLRLKVTDSTNVYKISESLPLQFIGSTLSISSQPQNASIISGQSATFNVTAASTDDVTLTYQWQESQDSGTTWADITGDTTSTLVRSGDSTAASANNYQYRVQISSTSATNSPIYSDAATLSVTQGSITIDTQPQAWAGNEGLDATFSITVSNNAALPVTYQWQSWDGSAWQNVGTDSPTLTFTTVDYATYNGGQYQCIASIPGLGAVTSSSTTLTVYRTISIDTQPADVQIYATQNAAFSIVATTSSGTATYQWQESTDGGTTYSDISGATSDIYNITGATTAQDGNKYRVVIDVTGSNGAITSDAGTLGVAVQPTVQIVTHPADASVYQPDTHTFSVTANSSDASAITYQWQKSDDNATTWQDIPGATSLGYTTPATATATDNGDKYRVVISHPAATNSPLTSNVANLTVTTPVIQISAQPQSVSTTAGVPTSFAVTATVTSGKNITYQWQVSDDNGTTFTDITNAIASDITITGSAANQGYQYRVLVDSLGATQVTSQSATLTLTFIAKPSIQTSHVDTTTNKTFVRQPKVQASLFVSYLGNGHLASFWKITKVSDGSTVYDTTTDVAAAGDETNKVELTTIVLDWNTSYNITVKYKDAAGFISAESDAFSFTTPVADQPTFSLPIPTSLRPTITLNTVSYDNVNYTHSSTDWQIADDAQFSNVIYESMNDATNKTELEVPSTVVLQSSTNYYVRTRLNVT